MDCVKVIEKLGDKPPTDKEFLDDRIVDLAVATNRNSKLNDRVGVFLRLTVILIFFAVLVHMGIFVGALLH